MFNARRVKKKAAIIYSLDCQSFLMQRSSPSLSERERQFHCLVRSSIAKSKKDKKKDRKTEEKRKDFEVKVSEKECFPTPQRKKKPTSPTRNVVTEGKTILTRRNNNSTA